MPRILQINVNRNVGSTGRITEEIGLLAMQRGWESYIVHGRYSSPSASHEIQIGSGIHIYLHGLQTRLFDRHGLGSKFPTIRLIKEIKEIKPDVIHLHNIHGYYINIVVLFNFLAKSSIPVIWTLHDCWSFTGHCAYFDFAECDKWKTECHHCPQKKEYPSSFFIDRSTDNYYLKKKLFTSVKDMVLVPVSDWLSNLLYDSFLAKIPVQTIHNGVNTVVFKPQENKNETRKKYSIGDHFMILGVAYPWSKRKGFNDFINLSKLIKKDEVIVLVGLNSLQIKDLPINIIGLPKTENTQELIDLYSAADLFINPTWEDNFPSTNLESLASGTPVATYKTGGSIEAISPETGFIVDKGNIEELLNAINTVRKNGKAFYSAACRERAVNHFNKDDRFIEYVDLYEKVRIGP